MLQSSTVWMPVAVFLAVGSLAGLWVQQAEQQRSRVQHHLAQTIVRSQVLSLERQLDRCLSVSFGLAEIVRRTGQVSQFDALAADIIRREGGIAYLELAPQGLTPQVYPRSAHPAKLPRRPTPLRPNAAVPQDALTLEPVAAHSAGNVVMVGDLTVFVPTAPGRQTVWGGIRVGIHLERLLHSVRMQTLAFEGYDYELSRPDAAAQTWGIISRSSPVALSHPVTQAIALPQGNWRLAIAPKGGWQTSPQWFTDAVMALILSSVFSGGVAGLLHQCQSRRAIAQTPPPAPAAMPPTADLIQHIEHDLSIARANLAIVQQELMSARKFATLGHLAAGIAQNMSTSLAAIRAANTHLANAFVISLPQLPELLQSLDPRQQSCFFALIQPGRRLRSPRANQRRYWRQAIAQQFPSLTKVKALADMLVDLGTTQDMNLVAPLLTAPNAVQVLSLALDLNRLQENSQTIGIAAAHAAKILFALKSYSHNIPKSSRVPTYIPEHLDMILTLYAHRLQGRITVQRHYAPLPPILCDPDGLTHVWSNLIHNAIQAMPCQGELILEATRQAATPTPARRGAKGESGDFIVVSITDTGPGIPPALLPHIFDPCFTSQPGAAGMGLGLDMSRKIIEQHGGTLSLDSQPGRTTVQVWLPMGAIAAERDGD